MILNMNNEKEEDLRFNYDFIEGEYWQYYGIDPLLFIIQNQQFNDIRNAFFSLEESSKNIIDYFIIQRKTLPYVDMDIDKYTLELKEAYKSFHNNHNK